MADESVVVELLMTANQFIAEAQKAAKATEGIGKSSKKSTDEGASGFQKFNQKVQDNRKELTQVGMGMTAVGAVTTALAMKVAKVGVEYNTLQQTSRAALSTLMGSTEAANRQMDKLNAFTKTSPFSKAVFIEAQQTMIGFGISAQKVVPYLDAIQNAVAAIGGSNQDIAEITQVLAKVQSSGKITATTLMELGKRGIDAATLMGTAMGKTGAQIRADITAGAIGAEEALDALAQGMQSKFGGAAANVKETMTGALDRVSAAFRDLSSSAMEPFVGSEGGGLFVSWLNGAADMLRMLDKIPGPMKTVILSMTLLGGVALTAGGSLLMLAPRIAETQKSIQTLSTTMPKLMSAMKLLGGVGGVLTGVLAALAVGFMIAGQKAADNEARTESLRIAMGDLAGGVEDARLRVQQLAREGLVTGKKMDWGWLQKLKTGYSSAADALEGLGISQKEFTDMLVASEEEQDRFRKKLNDIYMADPFSRQGQAALEMLTKFEQWNSSLTEAEKRQRQLADATDESNGAMLGGAGAVGEYGNAIEETTSALEGYLDALKGLVDFERQRASNFADLEDAQAKQFSTLSKLTDQIEEHGRTVEKNTEHGEANRAYLRGLNDDYQSTLDAMIQMTDEQGKATYSSQQMTDETQRMREEFIATAEQLGMSSEDARAYADSLGLVPEKVATRAEFDDATAKAEVRAILEQFDTVPEELITELLAYGDDAIAVAELVAEAITEGVPSDKLTKLLANGDDAITVSANVQAEIDAVKQHNPARIAALNAANPEVNSSQKSIDSVRQKEAVKIKAVDEVSWVTRTVQSALDAIKDKTVTIRTNHVNSGSTDMGRSTAYALGGAIFGPGTGTSDSIPAWLSNGEHVLQAREVMNLGGHANVYALRSLMRSRPQDLRAALGFAGGGTPGSHPVYVPQPHTFEARSQQVLVPAPEVRPNINVRAVVENPFTGEEIDARTKSVVVKFGGRHG